MTSSSGFEFIFGSNPFDSGFRFYGCGQQPVSRQERLKYKLKYLTRMRDDLEAKLAGLNATITTIERQLSEEASA